MIASILCFHYTWNCPRRQRQRCDYCLTTIVQETKKAGLSSVFNGFAIIQKRREISSKIVQSLKMQHFISLSLKTPTIDIAPAKLHPYVKSKTQTQMHEFASCFCPYRLHPHDTLCTYGAKQLRFQGFYMVDSTGLEPVTPCTSSRTGHSRTVAAARLSRTFSMFGHFGTLT